jgi:(5-formylfuran-3-yl)methyl phosphate transaminase
MADPGGAAPRPRAAMIPSARARDVEPFLAVEVGERAQALERAGVDVVHLEFGEPDFAAPPVVQEALEKAVKDGRARYTHSLGILPLREAIAEHYRTAYGVDVSPEQVLVTPGTSPAMLLLFGYLLEPGDEVVLSDPYYACYPNFIRYAGGVPAYVPVSEEDGFQYRPDAIRGRIGPRTKAIVINSPANPTGAVLSADRMAAIAGLGPLVVSDEIYHGLSYEGRDRTILEFTDRAFVLNGFSKRFAMTGWRLGYLIAPRDAIRGLQTLFGNFFISTNEFVQWAGVAALREGEEDARRFRQVFAERRRAMIRGLRAIGLGVGFEPTGAFYVLANARRYTSDSVRFAYRLLDEAHVAVTPGAAFGPNAEGYLRFSYASSIARIEEGLRRVAAFLARGA